MLIERIIGYLRSPLNSLPPLNLADILNLRVKENVFSSTSIQFNEIGAPS